MDSPNTPREQPDSTSIEAKTRAWLQLKQEMEELLATMEYVALMLRLGVRL
jgi:hypothetical protein